VRDNAKRLEVEVTEGMPSSMFEDLLLAVSEKTDGKKKAAVLIDEYDAPLLQVLSKNDGMMDERVRETRDALHSFLLVTKSSAHLTHCQVIMSANMFSLSDMPSQMNHLRDITHDKRFGAAMGFSWAEIEAAFGPAVETLAGSRNETVPDLRAEMSRRYGGYCYDGHQKVFNAWDVSCALQQQLVEDFWLSVGFGSWLKKLLRPNVAPALFEKGVIIPELCAGNTLDKGLFEALRNNLPIDERQAWRALLQGGYLAVVEMKDIKDKASLVLKPPNDFVAAVVSAGIFEIFEPALRNALEDDDVAKVLKETSVFVESKTFWHIREIGEVLEKEVQGWYAMTWAALQYEFVPEQSDLEGRADFVFEGMLNTHVVEFGMVSVLGATSNTGSTSESVLKRKKRKSKRKREIDAVLKEKTAQVRKYVPMLKHKKPIRRWVALFTRSRGQLIQVTEVLKV